MLARSGQIPARGDWGYEVKWDGFRGLLSTLGRFRVKSRRGWDMTELIPELASFPVHRTFDGELVAFKTDGAPDFPTLCARLLNRHQSIRVTCMIFDVLSLDDRSLLGLPYSDRRTELKHST
jgi:bifunctional non-homologous end joining protein LigD